MKLNKSNIITIFSPDIPFKVQAALIKVANPFVIIIIIMHLRLIMGTCPFHIQPVKRTQSSLVCRMETFHLDLDWTLCTHLKIRGTHGKVTELKHLQTQISQGRNANQSRCSLYLPFHFFFGGSYQHTSKSGNETFSARIRAAADRYSMLGPDTLTIWGRGLPRQATLMCVVQNPSPIGGLSAVRVPFFFLCHWPWQGEDLLLLTE